MKKEKPTSDLSKDNTFGDSLVKVTEEWRSLKGNGNVGSLGTP